MPGVAEISLGGMPENNACVECYLAFLGVVLMPPFFAEEKFLFGISEGVFEKVFCLALLMTIPEGAAVFFAVLFFDDFVFDLPMIFLL